MTGLQKTAAGEDVTDLSSLSDRLGTESGDDPRAWSNGPGDTYGWHAHGQDKVLCCVRGSIVFHGRDGSDVMLEPGDRLEVYAGTDHAATVGPDGVMCVEVYRRSPG